MVKKKKVPAILFNDTNFRYPKGMKVLSEDELDIRLKSGEWNTGPVDEKNSGGVEAIKTKELSQSEKRAEIARLQAELGEEDTKEEPADPEKPKEEPVKVELTKKPLSHMNISELIGEADAIGMKVNEEWTKTQLYEAIKKRKR